MTYKTQTCACNGDIGNTAACGHVIDHNVCGFKDPCTYQLKAKYFSMTSSGGNTLYGTQQDIDEMLDAEGAPAGEYRITPVTMTDDEFKQLPEFEGF